MISFVPSFYKKKNLFITVDVCKNVVHQNIIIATKGMTFMIPHTEGFHRQHHIRHERNQFRGFIFYLMTLHVFCFCYSVTNGYVAGIILSFNDLWACATSSRFHWLIRKSKGIWG